jgi:DNA topoisomerase-1
VEKMPGRCPNCGSTILKRKSKKGYAYYACERGRDCGFMTWDVPTANDCPKCGQTMFKRSGRGRQTPFCINPECENFLPEDQRGYKRKTTTDAAAEQPTEQVTEPAETPAKKTAAKKTTTKKTAAKKTTTKKTTTKKTTTKTSSATTKKTAKKTAEKEETDA